MRRAAFLLLLSAAIPAAAAPAPGTPSGGATSPAAEEPGISEQLGRSVPLDLVLLDESGAQVSLKELIDKPTLLSLNYFKCAGICTPQLMNISRVLDQAGMDPGVDFQVLTVSFDGRDTPELAREKKAAYLKTMKRPIRPSSWRFLTGEPAATKALADSVGFAFQPRGEDFLHPAALIALSPKGVVTRYIYGLSYLPAELQMAVLEASQGLARPTVSKVLQFCYSWDPEGRKFAFNVTKVAGTVILLSAAVFISIVIFAGRRDARGR